MNDAWNRHRRRLAEQADQQPVQPRIKAPRVKTTRQKAVPVPKMTEEQLACELRGPVAGEIYCGCGGSQVVTVYVCNAPESSEWAATNRDPSPTRPGAGFAVLNSVAIKRKEIKRIDGSKTKINHAKLPVCQLCRVRWAATTDEPYPLDKPATAPAAEVPVPDPLPPPAPVEPFPMAEAAVAKARQGSCQACTWRERCPIVETEAIAMLLTQCPAGFWSSRSLTPDGRSASPATDSKAAEPPSGSASQTASVQSDCGPVASQNEPPEPGNL